MTRALELYDAAIASAARGGGTTLLLHISQNNVVQVRYSEWCADHRAGDEELLNRCAGATLDIGCGPGRLITALQERRILSLGVDVSAEAIKQSRIRGALVLHGDVFRRIPAHGRWGTILLADGNVGIGGNPDALLTRCRSLLSAGGIVLAELSAPHVPSFRGTVRLEADGVLSEPFPWAGVNAIDIKELAEASSFEISKVWTAADRWFVELKVR